MVKDWKTTLTGVVGVIGMLVKVIFSIDVTVEVQIAFVTVIVAFIGYFSKDSTPITTG